MGHICLQMVRFNHSTMFSSLVLVRANSSLYVFQILCESQLVMDGKKSIRLFAYHINSLMYCVWMRVISSNVGFSHFCTRMGRPTAEWNLESTKDLSKAACMLLTD